MFRIISTHKGFTSLALIINFNVILFHAFITLFPFDCAICIQGAEMKFKVTGR